MDSINGYYIRLDKFPLSLRKRQYFDEVIPHRHTTVFIGLRSMKNELLNVNITNGSNWLRHNIKYNCYAGATSGYMA